MTNGYADLREPVRIAELEDLADRKPSAALVENVDLVIVRYDNEYSVLYGRCLHRGALLADGYIDGHNLICGVHHWDYRYDTGVSEYNNEEVLRKFGSSVHEGGLWVDAAEIREFHREHPQPFNRDEYLGQFADTHPENTEPYTNYIRDLARNGLTKTGHHGPSEAMGVDRNTLPKWESYSSSPHRSPEDLFLTTSPSIREL